MTDYLRLTLEELYPDHPRLSGTDVAERQQLEREQLSEELEFIKHGSSCPISNASPEVLRHIRYQFPGHVVGQLLEEDFYQAKVLEIIACTIGTILYLPPVPTQSETHELFRNWLTKLVKTGDNSYIGFPRSEGTVVPFHVEVAESERRKVDIVHGAFIAMSITNQLRRFCPNFLYLFGVAVVPSPVHIGGTDRVGTALTSITPYAFYESLGDSITLAEYVKDCNFDEVCNLLLQVFYALQTAFQLHGYTNYNLTARTVMVRSLNKKVQLVYPTESGEEYLLTDKIAIISDLASSHAELSGVSYGKYLYSSGYDFGIKANDPHPFYDMHTLLFNTYTYMNLKLQIEFFQKILFRHFTITDDIEDFGRFGSGFEDLDYHFVTKIIRQNKFSFIASKRFIESPVWNCEKEKCYSAETIVRMLTPAQYDPDIFEAYEALQLVETDVERNKLVKELQNHYDSMMLKYDDNIREFVNEIGTHVEEFTQVQETLKTGTSIETMNRLVELLTNYHNSVYRAVLQYQFLVYVSEQLSRTLDQEQYITFLKEHVEAVVSSLSLLDWIENEIKDKGEDRLLRMVRLTRENLQQLSA